MSIETLRAAIETAADNSKTWFIDNAKKSGRSKYFERGKMGDDGTGAVYAYFSTDGKALYVGESSRYIKRRMHDQKSPQKYAEWWKSWSTVRFIQVKNRTDRITLELLLILSLQPMFNKKPGKRLFSKMFSDAD